MVVCAFQSSAPSSHKCYSGRPVCDVDLVSNSGYGPVNLAYECFTFRHLSRSAYPRYHRKNKRLPCNSRLSSRFLGFVYELGHCVGCMEGNPVKWGGLVYTGRSHQALDLTRSTSSRHSHGSGLHSSIDDPLAGAFRFSSFGVLYCSPVCGHEIGHMLIISDFDHPPERGHRTSRRVGEWRKEIPLFELLEPFTL